MSTTKIKVSNIASVTGTGNVVLSSSPTFTGTVSGITKSMVGLSNVDNTTDAGKPVSTATQTALNLKAPLASPTFTGTVTLPTSLLNVTNSSYPTIRPTLNLDFANSKVLDPRITFVRNSTATYYDGQTTALAEQNLVTYSQDFSNGVWAKNVTTTTANTTTAPDGTSTASTFLVNNTSTGGSMYQASGPTWVAGATVLFNLSTGTVGTVTSGSFTTTAITSVGNSWYRCSVVKDGYTISFYAKSNGWTAVAVQCSGSEKMRLYPSTTSTAITGTGNGTSGIYIWGAQLEQRSSVTAYTPTTTAAITNYIPVLMTAPAGVARFDYDPITRNSLGLLIEESRTNLATYSENFDNAAWTKTRATINSNVIVAPDGTLTADKLVEDTQTGAHHTNKGSYSFIVSTTYCLSVYVKAAERSNGTLGLGNVTALFGTGGNALAHYDLIAGTCVISSSNASSAGIQNISNGWFRVWLVATCTTAGSDTYFATFLRNGTATTTAYTGDGTSGLYLWGAQLEVGAFPTSYIPTVASTVTRAADQASMTSSGWYNQSQGSFFVVYNGGRESVQNGYARVIGLNSTSITFITSNGNRSGIAAWSGTLPTNLNIVGADFWDTGGKAAMSYSPIITTVAGNGVYTTTDNPTISFSSIPLSLITIGGPQYLNGHIRKLSYYPVALSSSNLVALTS